MLARWLALFPAAAALTAQTAPQPASIAGTVTNSVTGEPILRAHVTARCISADRQHGQQVYGALTNEKGEFSLTSPPAQHCWVDAERTGFVSPHNSGDIQLTSGMRKDGVKLSLTPTGAITGHVVNAAGEPVQGVNISAEIASGNFSVATSDDKGAFRIGGLNPGKYRVKASPQSMPLPPEIRSDGSTELKDAATYYPGSLEAKTAQHLEVKAGAEVGGVDIKLVQTPIVAVSGKVTGIPAGAKGVMVTAEPSGHNMSTEADGKFTIWRLDPGKYSLQAQHWGGQTQLVSAPIEIEVASTNVENLELRMVPPFEVAGQLRFDDEQARESPTPPMRKDGTSASTPPPQPLQVYLRPAGRTSVGFADAVIAADDSFTLERVQPAKYHVMVNGASGFVKSVRAGDTETDGDILDVRNGSAGPVTVTISSNFCEISGTVTDSNGPVSDAMVALVEAEDAQGMQTSNSDSGNYKFRVPPGKYKLAVVEAMTNRMWPDLDEYQPEIVEVSAGDKITKDLVKHRP
jgi:protocatechuate 3,4-dioxygenase beta subunit